MRTIVAGSRSITDFAAVKQAIEESGFRITELVSGGARGVDMLAEHWARENGVKIKRFEAQWSRRKRAAGPIRNVQMARYGESLVALWDGISPGTLHMIDTMRKMQKQTFVRNLMTGKDERR